MDGEFARLLGWVGTQGTRVLVGAGLLVLPVVAMMLVAWMHRLPHLRAYWHVPIVTRSSVIAGMLLGWSLLYADRGSPSFRVYSIFQVGGPWDVDWSYFLANRADPALYSYDSLQAIIAFPDTDPLLAFTLLIISIFVVIAIGAAFLYLRGADLLAGLLGVAFLCLFSQAVTIYLTALLAYTLNTLNFWAAAVALVILQYYRRVAPHGTH